MPTTKDSPIFIVDDDLSVLDGQRSLLLLHGYSTIECVQTTEQARNVFGRMEPAVVLLDLRLEGKSGLDLPAWIKEQSPETQTIVLTAANDTRLAVQCMRDGAYDFLVKGIDTDRLPGSIRNALEKRRVETENTRLNEALIRPDATDLRPFVSFISISEHIDRIWRYLDAIAPLSDPILLTGETGVGKELVAKAIHERSGRTGPYVVAKLGGLDDHFLSDTLFGHKREAFTGADRARDGLVKSAGGGTLFLDEFAEVSLQSQVRLLRLVELGEYLPLGSDHAERSDTRFVFATNKRLEQEVTTGRCRNDLYYRISSHHCRIPPIRERPEDIRPIIKHLMEHHSKRMQRAPLSIPRHVVARLARFPDDRSKAAQAIGLSRQAMANRRRRAATRDASDTAD